MQKYLSRILVPVAVLGLLGMGAGCGEEIPVRSVDAGASSDTGAPSNDTLSNDAGTQACSSFDLKFELTVSGSSPVYYSGATTCLGSWVSIAPANAPASGDPLLLTAHECNLPCPAATDGVPEAPAPRSLSWDGTYYPVVLLQGQQGAKCDTPACAAPGNYIATFCVIEGAGADGGADASTDGSPPSPTCKQVQFVWPPTSAGATVSATLP
jgi:hypothetical protein